METFVRIVLLALWALGLLLIIALPIIAVIVYQNRGRRKSYRALAEKFGLGVNLDTTARLTRATPTANGKIDGFSVLISATMSASRHFDVSTGTRLKSDLEKIVVFGDKHPYGQIKITSPMFGPAAKQGFERAFRVEGEGNGRLGEVLTPEIKKRFLDIRENHGATFCITLQADGKILAIESPPFTAKRRDRIAALLETMIALAKTVSNGSKGVNN